MRRSVALRWTLLGLLPVVLFSLVLLTGSADISLSTVLRSGGTESVAGRLILYSRLPRGLTALLAGAALAVAGLGMQTLLGNPLAGPFVLGIHAAATASVAVMSLLVPVWAATSLGATVAASIGAAAALILLLILAARVGSILKLTIFGVLLGYAFAAVVTLALQLASPRELSAFVGWTFGSFGRTDFADLGILGVATLAGVSITFLLAKQMDALYLGTEEATLLGVSLRRLRLAIFFAASLLVGGVTAFCGPLAFIGVAAPHLSRWLVHSSRHRTLLGACLLVGASVALIGELVASMPGQSGRLPLNAVLSLLGIPVIAGVLLGLGGQET